MERKPRQPPYKVGQRSSSLRKPLNEEIKIAPKINAKPAQTGKRPNIHQPFAKLPALPNKAVQVLDKSIEISKIQENIQRNTNTLRELMKKFTDNNNILDQIKKERAILVSQVEIEYETLIQRQMIMQLEMINSLRYEEPSDDYTYEELLDLGEQMGKVCVGLTDEQIDSLPLERVDSSTSCSICLSSINAGTKATALKPCHHLYHFDCIKQWLNSNKTCPLCLQEIQI